MTAELAELDSPKAVGLARWRQVFHVVVIDFVFAEVPGWPRARRAIERQITTAYEEVPADGVHFTPVENLSIDVARRSQEASQTRRKNVEEKARANLLAITVAATVVFTGLPSLTNQDAIARTGLWVSRVELLVTLVAVVYLLTGAYFAFRTFDVGRTFQPLPEDEGRMSELELAALTLWCAKQNDRDTLLRTNALGISVKCIRKGVLMLALLAALIVWRSIASGLPVRPPARRAATVGTPAPSPTRRTHAMLGGPAPVTDSGRSPAQPAPKPSPVDSARVPPAVTRETRR